MEKYVAQNLKINYLILSFKKHKLFLNITFFLKYVIHLTSSKLLGQS